MKNLKRILSYAAATFAALFAASPAFALGAVWQVPVTVTTEVIYTNSSDALATATIDVTGTYRSALFDSAITTAMSVDAAAITQCNTQVSAGLSAAMDVVNEVGAALITNATVSAIEVAFDSSDGCVIATDGNFANTLYAAFAAGGQVTIANLENNDATDDADFEVFFATDGSRSTAIAEADDLCTAAYPEDSAGDGSVLGSCLPAASRVVGPQAAASSDDDNDTLLYVGGAVAIAALAWWYWDGNPAAFSFSPDAGYSLTETGYAYRAGGRVDFRQDDLHLYWTAGGGSESFGYASGGEWNKDIWRATFSETGRGEAADYDFSLSAKYGEGIWEASPTYRLHSRHEEGGSETRSSLNLEGLLRLDRWVVRPSAGFRWRRADEFGETARFHMSAVREF